MVIVRHRLSLDFGRTIVARFTTCDHSLYAIHQFFYFHPYDGERGVSARTGVREGLSTMILLLTSGVFSLSGCCVRIIGHYRT